MAQIIQYVPGSVQRAALRGRYLAGRLAALAEEQAWIDRRLALAEQERQAERQRMHALQMTLLADELERQRQAEALRLRYEYGQKEQEAALAARLREQEELEKLQFKLNQERALKLFHLHEQIDADPRASDEDKEEMHFLLDQAYGIRRPQPPEPVTPQLRYVTVPGGMPVPAGEEAPVSYSDLTANPNILSERAVRGDIRRFFGGQGSGTELLVAVDPTTGIAKPVGVDVGGQVLLPAYGPSAARVAGPEAAGRGTMRPLSYAEQERRTDVARQKAHQILLGSGLLEHDEEGNIRFLQPGDAKVTVPTLLYFLRSATNALLEQRAIDDPQYAIDLVASLMPHAPVFVQEIYKSLGPELGDRSTPALTVEKFMDFMEKEGRKLQVTQHVYADIWGWWSGAEDQWRHLDPEVKRQVAQEMVNFLNAGVGRMFEAQQPKLINPDQWQRLLELQLRAIATRMGLSDVRALPKRYKDIAWYQAATQAVLSGYIPPKKAD